MTKHIHFCQAPGTIVEIGKLSCTCPDMVVISSKNTLNHFLALYDLCDQSRWAPIVIANVDAFPKAQAKKKECL